MEVVGGVSLEELCQQTSNSQTLVQLQSCFCFSITFVLFCLSIVDASAVVRSTTERFCRLFTQFPPMIISCIKFIFLCDLMNISLVGDHLANSSSFSDKKAEACGGQVMFPGSHLGMPVSGPSPPGPPWLHLHEVHFLFPSMTGVRLVWRVEVAPSCLFCPHW